MLFLSSSSARVELAIKAVQATTLQQQNEILSRIDRAATSQCATMEGFVQQSLSSIQNQLSTHQQQTDEHLMQISRQRRASQNILDKVLNAVTNIKLDQQAASQLQPGLLSQENRQNNLDGSISQSSQPQPLFRYTSFVSFSMTRSRKCLNGCVCPCHKRRRFMTPELVKNIIGALFIGYTGRPMLEDCSEKNCQDHSARLLELTYYFPIWIVSRVIFLIIGIPHTGSPTFGLVVRKVIPFSSEPYFFQMASSGNTEGIKSLFESCQADANDLSDTGNTALNVFQDTP